MTSKDTVIGLIQEMPGKITISEIVYRLHVIDEIRKGEADIKAGRVISQSAMKAKIKKWK
jgi:predicted transcriptional regulator